MSERKGRVNAGWSTLLIISVPSILFNNTAEVSELQTVFVHERQKGENLEGIRMQMYDFPYKIIQGTLKLPST